MAVQAANRYNTVILILSHVYTDSGKLKINPPSVQDVDCDANQEDDQCSHSQTDETGSNDRLWTNNHPSASVFSRSVCIVGKRWDSSHLIGCNTRTPYTVMYNVGVSLGCYGVVTPPCKQQIVSIQTHQWWDVVHHKSADRTCLCGFCNNKPNTLPTFWSIQCKIYNNI